MKIDYSSKPEISKAAIAVRKKHSALEWDAHVDDLIRLEGLDQGRYSLTSDKYSLAGVVAKIRKEVKALISVKNQVILLSDDIHHSREAFAKGHELGHSCLPWHREILYVCDEHDLSASTQAQMEWEANTFASEILLPLPLLKTVYERYPTAIETVLKLRDLTGASLEACAFAFASHHPGRCVLIKLVDDPSLPLIKVVKKMVSAKASKSALGSIERDQVFGKNHALYELSRSTNIATAKLHLGDEPNKEYSVSMINTTFCVLALIFDGE